MLFARTEDIVPAPEVNHAAMATLAQEAKEAGEEKPVLFNLFRHGHFDLASYQQYLAGNLVGLEHPEEEIERVVARTPS